MRRYYFTVLILGLAFNMSIAQGITLKGYVYETENRGFIAQAQVDILESPSKIFITSTLTDKDGVFIVDLPPGTNFLVRVGKDLFVSKEMIVDANELVTSEKKFLNFELERKPGYIFDVTLANPRDNDTITTSGIHGALIEVYNNTKEEEYLRLERYEYPNFKVTFEQGNHYTLLVRKEGYYAKRMEAYVNIEGCILCFDGIGSVRPGVSDVLTAGHQMGTLLANVELKPIIINEKTKLNNINYALGSAALNGQAKEELQTVGKLLKDNPGMKVELSSHTDSRGSDDMNMRLSQKRASVAKDYLISFGGIDSRRIIGKGYGETRLDNRCGNGVKCTERQHRRNRRTEIKIIEFNQKNESDWKPLSELKRLEKMEEMLKALQNQEVVEIPVTEDKNSPQELKQETDEKKPKNIGKETLKVEQKENLTQTSQMARVENEKTKSSAEDPAIDKQLKEAAQSELGEIRTMSDSYTGYKIQVHSSDELLSPDHKLFMVFGNLEVEKTTVGYAYVMGDFNESDDAEIFLNNIIKPRYPEAILVKYEDGKRNSVVE